ncbi:MAG: flagellar hook-length control protein FliK, partial [Thalassolituus sp.]
QLNALTAQLLNRLMPGTEALSNPASGHLKNLLHVLPASGQLATPEGLRAAIANSPLNYEHQLQSSLKPSLHTQVGSQSLAGAQSLAETDSNQKDGISQLFRSLWANTKGNITTETQANGLKEAIQALTNRQQTPLPTTPTTTSPTSQRLTTAMSGSTLSSAGQADISPLNRDPAKTLSGNLKLVLLSLLTGIPGDPRTTVPAAATTSSTMSAASLTDSVLSQLLKGASDASVKQTGNSTGGAHKLPPLIAFLANAGITDTAEVRDTINLLRSMLSQTESEQVRMIQNQDTSQFQTPLLWREGEAIRQGLMTLSHDAEGNQNAAEAEKNKRSRWQITLHFDLAKSGPLDVELDLCPPQMSATFWSENSAALADINQTLKPLRERLRELGADVSELRARHGRKEPGQQPVVRHSLVDIHT